MKITKLLNNMPIESDNSNLVNSKTSRIFFPAISINVCELYLYYIPRKGTSQISFHSSRDSSYRDSTE